jgi:hypothetical protein
MINDIVVITPPDFLHNDSLNILAVCPSNLVKMMLNDVLKESSASINLYVYETANETHDIKWLLAVAKIADCIILDVDNIDNLTGKFTSLLIAKPNTFYLTTDNTVPYNLISKNRVYDLAWLNIIINRGKNEET